MKTPLVIVSAYALATDYRTTLGITRQSLALRVCVAVARAWRTEQDNADELTIHPDTGCQCVDVKTRTMTVYSVKWERAEFLKP